MRMALLLGFVAVATTGCGASAFSRLPLSQTGAVDPCLGAREWNAHTVATSLADVDKKGGWNAPTCRATLADMACMTKVARDDLGLRYNAGAVLQRCGEPYQAEAVFRSVLDREPTFYRARVSAALLRYERSDVDGAIDELARAVWDSNDEDADALVHLAHLELARNGDPDDLDRARAHLERAIVLGDQSEATYVDLARTYVAHGSLDLATTVVEGALALHPGSAALHNMAGVVAVARRDAPVASKEFDEARALDPKSFDATMNRAALDLDMRDFERGEHDYRVALDLKPNDYDARVGLALTLDGQSTTAKRETAILQLVTAKELEPRRPEADRLLRVFSVGEP
jgi:tetratricopeptide (TPR) repeat protein